MVCFCSHKLSKVERGQSGDETSPYITKNAITFEKLFPLSKLAAL